MENFTITKKLAGSYRVEIGDAMFSIESYKGSWYFMFPNDEGKKVIQQLYSIRLNVRTLTQAKEMVKQLALNS